MREYWVTVMAILVGVIGLVIGMLYRVIDKIRNLAEELRIQVLLGNDLIVEIYETMKDMKEGR